MISPLLFVIASGYVKGTGPGLIYNALFLTILIFAALTTYVFVSKKDFSYMGATLTIGIFMVFGALIVNMFVHSSSLDLALSIIIVILFSGFVLFDTSRILKRAHEIPPTLGALSLYLDFMNIFLALIRILGGGRRD
jgi:FtsH-binding integral membrane protein